MDGLDVSYANLGSIRIRSVWQISFIPLYVSVTGFDSPVVYVEGVYRHCDYGLGSLKAIATPNLGRRVMRSGQVSAWPNGANVEQEIDIAPTFYLF